MKPNYSVLSVTFCSFLFGIFCSSCGTQVRYIGNSLPQTKSVDVYVEENSIKKPYNVIGKGYADQTMGIVNPERIQQKAIVKAKQKGADAILISDFTIVYPAVKGTTSLSRDSTITARNNVSISSGDNKEFIVYFIKYKP